MLNGADFNGAGPVSVQQATPEQKQPFAQKLVRNLKFIDFLLIDCFFRRSSSKKEVNPAVMAEDAEVDTEAVEADMAVAEEAAADSEVICYPSSTVINN